MTASRGRSRSGSRVLAAAGAALLLAGCGDVSPGAAATIDGEAISVDEVDEYARAVCAAETTGAELAQQPHTPTSTSTQRESVLTILINAELAELAVDEFDLQVPPSAAATPDSAATAQLFEAMAAEDAGTAASYQEYDATLRRLVAVAIAIGAEQTGGQKSEQVLASAGGAWLASYAEDHDVQVDPRFGDFTSGRVVGGSGSLSVASGGESGGGSAANLADLPASQICR